MASTRQRQEEEDRMRQEAGDSRLAKEYAQKMMEWGRVLHARIQSIERFMEVRCVICILVYSFMCQSSNFLIVCNLYY
jgi:hypothetical protein